MPDPVDLSVAFNLPPEDAIAYFRQKGYAFSWNWHDVWQEAHAKAFTVAKAMKLDVLQDIRGAVDKAVSDGTTFKKFQDDLEPLLKTKGWWGKVDGAQLGSASRLETIFRTNTQSAYMAGRYKQQMENADDRPYWQYVAVMDGRTRPAHARLNGKVFRFDDPFWNTHYPPLGFRCRCRTRALTEKQVKARGIDVESGNDAMIWEERQLGKSNLTRPVAGYKDPASGETIFTDMGWSSNPGKAALETSLFQKAQAIYEGCIGGEFSEKSGFPCSQARKVFSDVLDGLKQSFNKAEYDTFIEKVLADKRHPQNKVLAGYVDLQVYDWLAQWNVAVKNPQIWLYKNNLTHLPHPRAVIGKEKYTIAQEEIYGIPDALTNPVKMLFDTKDQSVLYFYNSILPGKKNKMVVRVNYNNLNENMIITVDRVAANDFPKPRYMEIE